MIALETDISVSLNVITIYHVFPTCLSSELPPRTHRKTINNLSKKLSRFASLKNSNLLLRWILQLAAMTLSITSQASPNSFIVFPSRRHRSNGLMTCFISHQISLNLRCLNLMAIINSERVEVTTASSSVGPNQELHLHETSSCRFLVQFLLAIN